MTNPTPTDWRALCAELHAAVQLYTGQNPAAAETPPNELVSRLMDAMAATAAALRAAADQVVPDQGDIWTRDLRGDAWVRWEERKLIRSELLAIAAELEGNHD
jgi:hypothetical protein